MLLSKHLVVSPPGLVCAVAEVRGDEDAVLVLGVLDTAAKVNVDCVC